MKTKFLFLCFSATILMACENNDPIIVSKQTTTMDNVQYTYYVTDIAATEKSTFSKNEQLIVHLDVQNMGNDTIWANSQFHGGMCYDTKGNGIEELSAYVYEDSVPVIQSISPNKVLHYAYAFKLDVSSGVYYYKNPSIQLFSASVDVEKDSDPAEFTKNVMIPLSINFKVQ